MRFDRISIDGFGRLEGVTLEDLGAAPIVVVLGDNEAGKSTLFEALVTLLYGFDPASPERHPARPWTGAPMRMRARIVEDDGSTFELVRETGRRAGGFRIDGDGEHDLGNGPLPAVEKLERGFYRELFALTVDDLAGLGAKTWIEIESRLLEGGGSRRLESSAAVLEALRRDADRLWRPDRRGKPRSREIERDLARCQDERRQAGERSDRARTLRAWLVESRQWRSRESERISARRELESLRLDLQRAEEVRGALLDEIKQRRELQVRAQRGAAMLVHEVGIRKAGISADRVGAERSVFERLRQAHARDARRLESRLRASLGQGPAAAGLEKLETQALRDLEGICERGQRDRDRWVALGFVTASALLAAGGAGALSPGLLVLALTGLTVFTGLARALVRRRMLSSLRARCPILGGSDDHLLLVGRPLVIELFELRKLARKVRRLRGLAVARQRRLDAGRRLRGKLAARLGWDSATAWRDWKKRLDKARVDRDRCEETSRDLARLRRRLVVAHEAAAAASERLESLDVDSELTSDRTEDLLRRMEDGLGRRLEEESEAVAELRVIESAATPDSIDGEIQVLRAELDALGRERDRLSLLAGLVREAERGWRAEHRPRVLELASRRLRQISGGRYREILEASVSTGSALRLAGPDGSGALRTIDRLSRGTKEQVYMALRLALVEMADPDGRLPVALDEVMINWDSGRRAGFLDSLRDFANRRQVFVFSCHAEQAADLETRLGARVIRLEGAPSAVPEGSDPVPRLQSGESSS